MKHYFSLSHAALKFFLVLMFFFHANFSYAAEPLKIKGLGFDNSDNIIFVKSTGQINLDKKDDAINSNVNEISKGFLENPKRAYIDITNAILTTSAQNYELKNSIFDTVKISQFSLNPNVVRIVFKYKNENANTNAFNAFSNNKGIVIRYTNELNKTNKNFTVYSNTPDNQRSVFFENTTSSLVQNVPKNASNKDKLDTMFEKNNAQLKEYHLQSKFYVNSITQSAYGIMLKGTGFLSLKPTLVLTSPDRLVIDIDDSVLAKNLRNKSFPIGNMTVNSSGVPIEREIIRMGQNTTNTVRFVIQGKEAKLYRAVISPDMQNLFIAKRGDIINSNITETKSTIKSFKKTEDETDIDYEFNFISPVAFSAFEENSKLYIDFNNVQSLFENAKQELAEQKEIETVKIALDKFRVIIPLENEKDNVQIKASPDMKTLIARIKPKNKEDKSGGSFINVPLKKKGQSISNLYKVVIDAGHGGTDVGATRAGIYEKNITLSIAKMVEKNLQAKGVQTTMTLDRDKTVSLQERCDISNEVEPNVFVSVHVNSSVNDAITGVETHWWKDNSREYANVVHKHLKKYMPNWNTKDRGLFRSQFYVINHTTAPAILVETGFISNTEERNSLITQKRQKEIAKAISDGVMDYLKNKGQD